MSFAITHSRTLLPSIKHTATKEQLSWPRLKSLRNMVSWSTSPAMHPALTDSSKNPLSSSETASTPVSTFSIPAYWSASTYAPHPLNKKPSLPFALMDNCTPLTWKASGWMLGNPKISSPEHVSTCPPSQRKAPSSSLLPIHHTSTAATCWLIPPQRLVVTAESVPMSLLAQTWLSATASAYNDVCCSQARKSKTTPGSRARL